MRTTSIDAESLSSKELKRITRILEAAGVASTCDAERIATELAIDFPRESSIRLGARLARILYKRA